MRKILLTGGAGFIGSSLADRLTDNKDNFVVILDNLLTGKKANLPDKKKKNWSFIKGDVNSYNDLSAIMLSHSFDYVFHYAAVVGVQRTLEKPLWVLRDIEGFKHLLDLAKNTEVKRVLFASSSEVYGASEVFPQHETTTPLDARLPYAITKKVGEAFLNSYYREFGLEYTAFRFFNTYGPKQNTDFVMSYFIHSALRNEPVTVYGDGSQKRTFCYIDDNLDACLNAFNENKYLNEVINIGNPDEFSIKELAEKVIELTNSKSEIVYLPELEEGDMPRRQPHIERMKKLLNRDFTPLEEGIKKVLENSNF